MNIKVQIAGSKIKIKVFNENCPLARIAFCHSDSIPEEII